MRHARAGSVPWLVLLLCAVASSAGSDGHVVQAGGAGPAPADVRVVKVDGALVRSGASDKFYPTNRLERGDAVEVVGEVDGGWLKIKPPAGSYSWINTHFLEHITLEQPNHVVTLQGANVPVYIGTALVDDHRPTVVGARLEPGAQVTNIGPMKRDADGTWMKIEPPPTEHRYIRASDVERHSTPAGQILLTGGTAPAGPLAPSTAPSANVLTPGQLYNQAITADRQGKIDDAVALYAQLAVLVNRSNPKLAAESLARANWLKSGQHQPPPPPMTAAAPVQVRPPTSVARETAPATTTSTFRARDAGPAPAPVASRRQPPPGVSSFRGRLERAGRVLESSRTYRVELFARGTITYVVPVPGINLEPYVGRVVEVWGTGVYNGELRANLLHVHQVFPEE